MALIENELINLVIAEINKRMPQFNKEGVEYKKYVADNEGLIVAVDFESQEIEVVEVVSNTIQLTDSTLKTGLSVMLLTDDTLPLPLVERTKYFIRKTSSNLFKIYLTKKDAEDDTNVIDITSTGSGTSTIEVFITEPVDFGIGAISNLVEWNRRYSRNLIEQLDFTNVTDRVVMLDSLLNVYFDVPREVGESDPDYLTRTRDALLKYPQVSGPGITQGVERYGDAQAIGGTQAAAACDFTFLDVFDPSKVTSQKINAAWLGTKYSGLAFTFIIVMRNVDPVDYGKIKNFLDSAAAGGINYIVYFIT